MALSGGRMVDLKPLHSKPAIVSGIPTLTTSTLTPTTLRQIYSDDGQNTISEGQAGFIPPSVLLTGTGGPPSVSSEDSSLPPNYSSSSDTGSMPPSPPSAKSRRSSNRRSGRNSQQGDQPLSENALTNGRSNRNNRSSSGGRDEDDERKRLRRERNKEAAARCRKRRLDTTLQLESETKELESKKAALINEIQFLATQKDELQFILEGHKPVCKLIEDTSDHRQSSVVRVQQPQVAESDISSSSKESFESVSEGNVTGAEKRKRLRPTSLTVQIQRQNSVPKTQAETLDAAGNAIMTPSSVLGPSFDALTAGGTGLTPTPLTAITPVNGFQLDTPCGEKTIVKLDGDATGSTNE